MFKKTTAAIILSAVIMAGSSVSAFAEAPVQTVVVEQEYGIREFSEEISDIIRPQ